MKKLTCKIGQLLSFFAVASILSSCFGTFALTRKLYTWNDSLGNKFLKTIVFWGLNFIPVYGIAGGIDFIILNLIEFWTGSNPLAMEPGKKETRVVWYAGSLYELSAEHCRFTMRPLSATGSVQSLFFDTAKNTVYLQCDGHEEVALGHFQYPAHKVEQVEVWVKATK